MKSWWRNLPLHIKLHLPIQAVLLVLLPLAHLWVMDKFESTVLGAVRQKTEDSILQSLLALNSMMLSGTMANRNVREVFFDRMSAQQGVLDFHLVRTDAIEREFGPGLERERRADQMDRLAADTGVVQSAVQHGATPALRVVVPFAARHDYYGVDCLQCHHVAEGTVLGTISLRMDLQPEYVRIGQLGSALLAGQVVLQLLLFLVINRLTRSVTRPVVDLEAAMQYIREQQDFSRRVRVTGNDEIGRITAVFNGFIAHIEDLHSRLAEKIAALEHYHDRNEHELRIGSDILSRITDAQSRNDPAVRLQIKPAAHYSGDLILLSRTPSGALHMMLADAVGHGLIAAINLLPLSQIFNAMSKKGFPVSRIAEELNSKIHRLMPVDRFVGAALVSVDFGNRVIEVWNGGLPAPLLMRADGTILHRWPSRNVPLGILDPDAFRADVELAHCEEDCQLFIFSDGLLEAGAPDGGQFGAERIVQLLSETAADRRFDMLMAALDRHLGGRPAHDDMSLAMVSITLQDMTQASGNQATHPVHRDSGRTAGSYWRIAVSLGADELKSMDVVAMVAQMMAMMDVAAEHYSRLYVILNELINNALDHGILQLDSAIKRGPEGFENYMHLREERLHTLASGSMDIEIERAVIEGEDGVRIRVIDSGPGFNYAEMLNDVPLGSVQGQYGRGIALARSMACKLDYSGRGNEVTAYYVCSPLR